MLFILKICFKTLKSNSSLSTVHVKYIFIQLTSTSLFLNFSFKTSDTMSEILTQPFSEAGDNYDVKKVPTRLPMLDVINTQVYLLFLKHFN